LLARARGWARVSDGVFISVDRVLAAPAHIATVGARQSRGRFRSARADVIVLAAPVLDIVIAFIQRVFARVVAPRRLSRLDFKDGIPG
jgi:hypothetical protein